MVSCSLFSGVWVGGVFAVGLDIGFVAVSVSFAGVCISVLPV